MNKRCKNLDGKADENQKKISTIACRSTIQKEMTSKKITSMPCGLAETARL